VAEYDSVFLSLNRYERKKNINLAIDALLDLKMNSTDSRRVLLVVAGGYDLSVPENTQYLVELMDHCQSLKIPFSYTPDTAKRSESEKRKNDNIEIESNPAVLKSSPVEKSDGKEMEMDVHVVFRTSISEMEREALLERADALLYTPDR
jgi:alpha-1,3/alpha-1,6-mannosyltransferase